jgi:L-threonylcarbamoyladenylate synthase
MAKVLKECIRPKTLMSRSEKDMERIAQALREGEIAIFPTDTVYGIGCMATDSNAVRKLSHVRGRDAGKPFIVLLASTKDLSLVAKDAAPSVRHLMERFWPGPLTIVLPAIDGLPEEVTAGTGTVAVRVPGNALTRELIAAVGSPLIAPSANHPTKEPARNIAEAKEAFPGVAVLDGGESEGGVSTVIALRPLRIIREGRISRAEIEAAMR